MYYFVSLVVLHKPVALLSHPCRLPVAFLSPSGRKENTLPLSCRSPVAFSCRFLLSLPCRFPVAASPVALLSSSFRFPVAYPVAMSCFLSPPCRNPVTTLSQPCRPPVALLSQLRCRLPVACLSLPVAFLPLSCRFPVVFLSPPCRLPVATLSPSCRSLPHFAVACLAWPESSVPASPLRGFCSPQEKGLPRTTQDTPHGKACQGYSQLRNSPEGSWLGQARVTGVPNLWYAPVSSQSSVSAPAHGSVSRTERQKCECKAYLWSHGSSGRPEPACTIWCQSGYVPLR